MGRRADRKACLTFLQHLAAVSRDPSIEESSLDEFDWLAPAHWPTTLVWLLKLRTRQLPVEGCPVGSLFEYLRRSSAADHIPIWERVESIWHDCSDPLPDRSAQPVLCPSQDPLEWLLQTVGTERRKSQRYYATPLTVADAMIRWADQQAGPLGLGIVGNSDRKIVDPAAGSGVFFRQMLRYAIQHSESSSSVDRQMHLARLVHRWEAWELDPLTALVGSMFLGWELLWWGGDLQALPAWSVSTRDALQPSSLRDDVGMVIGNPPYAALTERSQPWIEQLMAGQIDGVSYRPEHSAVGAQKHWLHDDYVRFLRLGHYLIAETGVLCLVTNRGFLEGRSFETLRRQMGKHFSDCRIVDLQSSARSLQEPPENRLFGIGSGVAIGLWTRRRDSNVKSENSKEVAPFAYRRLTGTVSQKNDQLVRDDWQWYQRPPGQPWIPPRISLQMQQQYDLGMPIDQLMTESWSAIVTARDRIVIDWEHDRLSQRLDRLSDKQVSTEQIRQEWFQRTRSRRYQNGDTRSWKLEQARQHLMQIPQPAKLMVRCLYRPLDAHWIFLCREWLDWPRLPYVESLMASGSLGLVVRRAAPPGSEYRYFAISGLPVVDGVLRSDAFGNETVFNLYQKDGRPNMKMIHLRSLAKRYGKTLPQEQLPIDRRAWSLEEKLLVRQWDSGLLNSEIVLCWIYRQWSDPEFQRQWAECLCEGYPRWFAPEDREQARRWLIEGQQKIAWEVAGQHEAWPLPSGEPVVWHGTDRTLQRRKVRFDVERSVVWINETTCFGHVPPSVWDYRQGSYRVLDKFLKGRSSAVVEGTLAQDLQALLDRLKALVNWQQGLRSESVESG